jgi:hypothetical protein
MLVHLLGYSIQGIELAKLCGSLSTIRLRNPLRMVSDMKYL